jgi:hypothetical protein
MSSVLVGRQGTTRWSAAGILTVAIVGSGLVALAAVALPRVRAISARPPEPAVEPVRPVMKDYEFERLLTAHYEEKHGGIVRNYAFRLDTKQEVVQTFLNTAYSSKVEACIALTDVEIKGFCPKDLMDRVDGMAGYKGPWGTTDLNDWVKKLERQDVSINLVGVPHRLTKPVNWWVLFCGVFEQYEAEITKRCLAEWRSFSSQDRDTALKFIEQRPGYLLTENTLNLRDISRYLALGLTLTEGRSLYRLSNNATNLKAYRSELPNAFCDLHAVYSRRYIDFVRLEYNNWCDAGRNSGPPPGGLEALMEAYVRDLLKERDVKVGESKGAG